jgi:hypothetical protein
MRGPERLSLCCRRLCSEFPTLQLFVLDASYPFRSQGNAAFGPSSSASALGFSTWWWGEGKVLGLPGVEEAATDKQLRLKMV